VEGEWGQCNISKWMARARTDRKNQKSKLKKGRKNKKGRGRKKEESRGEGKRMSSLPIGLVFSL
jgi:hypothetical protein